MLKEYDNMKEVQEEFIEDFSLFIKECYHFVLSVEKIQKVKTNCWRIMLLSKCAVCASKKLKFIKDQEPRKGASVKALRDKAFNITKNSKYDEYQRGLPSMAYNLFIKKFQVVLLKVKLCQTKNKLKNHNRKSEKWKVHSTISY